MTGTEITWSIDYRVFEREKTSDLFAEIATWDVTIEREQHAAAEAAAKNNLTPPQRAYALEPAADVASLESPIGDRKTPRL